MIDSRTTALAREGVVLATRRCRLVVLSGREAGRAFDLERGRTRVGKSSSCEVALDDPAISREHFAVERRGEEFVLADLESLNGTFLDGTRVREAYLHPGTVVRVGETTIAFEALDQATAIEPSPSDRFGDLLGASLRMRQVFAALARLGASDTTVLLLGETGTGKGHAARALHEASPRRSEPFQVFDCGAVARTLVESELFGHEKGAFTGADAARAGALEASGRGTLFVDELDELPLDLQPKLLRALEERRFVRVGATRTLEFRARVVAATKRDLRAEVAAGRFRADLYFRVAVAVVAIPSLRERPEDVPLLAARFLPGGQKAWDRLDRATRAELCGAPWPGNVRELRNVLERVAIGIPVGEARAAPAAPAPADEIAHNLLPADFTLPFKQAKERLIERFERRYLSLLMARHRGRVAPAARETGLDRKYLGALLRKHGLVEDDAGEDEAGSRGTDDA